VFSLQTGQILSRRFPKFFNLNEKPYTALSSIDFTRKFIILEKLDGSMVAPFYLKEKLLFATRLGASKVILNNSIIFFIFSQVTRPKTLQLCILSLDTVTYAIILSNGIILQFSSGVPKKLQYVPLCIIV
jgi:hypothetical protein